jgi:hypothetical protein
VPDRGVARVFGFVLDALATRARVVRDAARGRRAAGVRDDEARRAAPRAAPPRRRRARDETRERVSQRRHHCAPLAADKKEFIGQLKGERSTLKPL